MSRYPDFRIDNRWIMAQRGPSHPVDARVPYAFFTEKERTPSGRIEEVATVFLTNSECPFKCLMCDLWKNTTPEPVSPGTIPRQIEYTLSRLPAIKHIKLYNSGSFFDPRAIPTEDHKQIAELLNPFETVTVESHPAFIGKETLEFSKMIRGRLEVAIGLETVHPEVLRLLNKKMTLELFDEKVRFLLNHQIGVRAFILLKPPFMTEEEGIIWAQRSLDHAFETGVQTSVVIPVRPGNGAMDLLARKGFFTPPDLRSLVTVMEYGILQKKGIVLADLWDLHLFSPDKHRLEILKNQLIYMNLYQKIPEKAQFPQTLETSYNTE